MIISFPHMGNLSVVLKTLFSGLGCEVLTPPSISKKSIELGIKYSPEAVCLPFKITLGNYIEALEQGANTIVTCGGVGPCRLGYYAEVQRCILQELDYQFEMIIGGRFLKLLRSISVMPIIFGQVYCLAETLINRGENK